MSDLNRNDEHNMLANAEESTDVAIAEPTETTEVTEQASETTSGDAPTEEQSE